MTSIGQEEVGIQTKLQGNTAATTSAAAQKNPPKEAQGGQNLPLGDRDEPEATKNIPAPSISGDSKRRG